MLKKINNEKGVALITALLVLAILTMLGLAAVLTSTTDMQISTNEKIAVQGQYAAEAGIEDVMAFVNRTTNLEPAGTTWSTTPPPNPQWVKSRIRTISAGGAQFFTYSATLSYKKVSGTGTDYDDSVAFYNRTAGFSKAPSGSGGWPVYQIKSIATRGNFQSQEVVLELTKNTYSFNILGGLTAAGAINMSGNFDIDSRFYDKNGTLLDPQPVGSDPACKDGTLAAPKPAVFANGSTITGGSADTFHPASTAATVDTNGTTPVPTTPWDALGMDYDSSTSLYPGNNFVDIFPPSSIVTAPPAGASIGNYYYNTDVELQSTGNGLMIVHNPLFTPPACGACGGNCGVTVANSCSPRILSKGGGSPRKFLGVIIADAVDFQGSGNIEITGAIVSLSTFETTNWTGTGNINFSCQAIEKFAAGQINKKLNWHRE